MVSKLYLGTSQELEIIESTSTDGAREWQSEEPIRGAQSSLSILRRLVPGPLQIPKHGSLSPLLKMV